jgi:tetratricopeptide (TPR) repeat protein
MKQKLLIFIGLMTLQSTFAVYEVDVILKSGAVIKATQLVLQGDRIRMNGERPPIATNAVERLNFQFRELSPELCASLYSSGRVASLRGRLDQILSSFSGLKTIPSNLDVYWYWLLKCEYWGGNEAGALRAVDVLQGSRSQQEADVAEMYATLIWLDRKNIDRAQQHRNRIRNAELVSLPMSHYIEARMLYLKKEYKKALREVVKIVALYPRDREWMAPALFLEAELYMQLGAISQVEQVVQELRWSYPDTEWMNKSMNLLQPINKKVKMGDTI